MMCLRTALKSCAATVGPQEPGRVAQSAIAGMDGPPLQPTLAFGVGGMGPPWACGTVWSILTGSLPAGVLSRDAFDKDS